MVEELLLVPGPTAIHNRVKKILSNNHISHSDTLFHESFIKLIEYTKYLFQNNSGHQFILSGSGTLGMEASVVNILEPKDSVLILDTGYFGNRFSLLTNMIGCDTDVLKFKNGKHADTNIVENALSKKHYKAICMTHVDTSTTVVNPIENLTSLTLSPLCALNTYAPLASSPCLILYFSIASAPKFKDSDKISLFAESTRIILTCALGTP